MKNTQLIIYLFPFFIFSQNIEKIRMSDTIYVLFDKKEYQKKEFFYNKEKDTSTSILYQFYDDKNNRISFYSDIYLDFDDMENNKKAVFIKKKHKDLMKKKDEILNSKFFIKYGIEKSYYLIQKKVVFLIDIEEKKRGTYLLKEVKTLYENNE